ncbi:MAG: prephenate dehydratase [Thermoguttaceae bacterium]|nr:prephenate dehydratase [Thermoguttaceae bacterium]
MAKKTRRTHPTTKAGAEKGADVPALTAELKRLDRELIKLFSDRARLAGKIGELRQGEGCLSDGLVQDDEVLALALESNHGPLSDETLRAVFRELNSGARSLIKRLRIAFLGPLYSYSHLAAMRRFGQSVEFAPVGTIAAVFEEVDRGQSDYGIVPFENSTDGRIADTLDMFTRLPVRICGQVRLDIHHALLGKCPRTEIKEVYSRPQALSQCRNWLARHLPAARPIEVTSTSTAAQLAKEKPGAAAIASLEAGVNYGLDVLAERIEDNPDNRTWFAVIGDHTGKRTGNDHTAIMFQTEHRFGALADVLAIFKRNRINLTWIESFPVPGTQRVYLFFVELEGHEQDARFRRAVAALERRTLRMEILGSYPVDTSTD